MLSVFVYWLQIVVHPQVTVHQGKPDLFLTFTCNPKWPKITQNLLPGQTASDRPDLVARVFKMKVSALKKDLKDSVL